MTKTNKPYSMQREGDSAEITMYGDVVESQPVDFWTGQPVEGNFIIGDQFLKDLDELEGCRTLVIRMNSYGGDAGVSIMIHNRLRELSRNGMVITCIVDGVAMSGGSLIMCAADLVQVNPSSLIMIHNCWSSLFGSYNATELRKMAESSDAYDRAQVSIYAEKTGMPEAEILSMMAETTYMTGREAVENGFADELIQDAGPVRIAASADRKHLFAGGRDIYIPDGIPEKLISVMGSLPTENKLPILGEGGQKMATNVEELRAENPELAAQLETAAAEKAAAAVAAERARLQEIEEISALYPAELVQAAKYGDKPMTAAELAYQAAVLQARKGAALLDDMQADAKQAESVSAACSDGIDTTGVSTTEHDIARVKAAMEKIKEEI